MTQEKAAPGVGRRDLLKLSAVAGAALAGASLIDSRAAAAADGELSLKGKRIGISATGTDHFFDLQAYNAQIEEVKRLGGEPIAVDAGRNDGKLVSQLQTLIAQKPDAIVQILGTLSVIDPWLKKARDAGIPVLTVDVGSTHSINNTTSDNWGIGKDLALQLVSDIGGEGNIVVFNGFYGVTPCAIRYDQLVNVVKYFPKVKILEPELRDVIPNTVQDAFTQITALLNKYPEKGSIKAIWSAWDIPQLWRHPGPDRRRPHRDPHIRRRWQPRSTPAGRRSELAGGRRRGAAAGRNRPHGHPECRQASRWPDIAARDLRARADRQQGECQRSHQEARHRLTPSCLMAIRLSSGSPFHTGRSSGQFAMSAASRDGTGDAIHLDRIVKRFDGALALNHASLRVTRGTVHGLVGQNGAGKSTLIKLLAGLHQPDEGRIEIDGQAYDKLTPHRVEELGIHFIHQDRLLVPTFTVGEALFLGREPRIAGTPFLDRRV